MSDKIYIFRFKYKSGDFFKVGRTKNLDARKRAYRNNVPNNSDLVLEYVCDVTSITSCENVIKQLFRNKYKLEWFSVDSHNELVLENIKLVGIENITNDCLNKLCKKNNIKNNNIKL